MEHTYNYKPANSQGGGFLGAGLVMAAIAGFFLLSGYSVRLRGSGRVISAETAAPAFYVVLALAAIFVVIGLLAVVRKSPERTIVVGPTRVVVPKGQFSRDVVTIDPRSIERVKVGPGSTPYAKISYPGGSVKVLSVLFRDRTEFPSFVASVNAVRTAAASQPH